MTMKNRTSTLPPLISERASAESPTVVKNITLSGVSIAESNSKRTSAVPRRSVTTRANRTESILVRHPSRNRAAVTRANP